MSSDVEIRLAIPGDISEIMRFIRELAKLETSNIRMEWRVLNWNANAIQFYEKLGAKGMADWITFRLDIPRRIQG